MYLNVICMKCGKTLPFQSTLPLSVDKVVEGWNVISDETNGQIISVRGSEIASICSQAVENTPKKSTAINKSTDAKKGAKRDSEGSLRIGE